MSHRTRHVGVAAAVATLGLAVAGSGVATGATHGGTRSPHAAAAGSTPTLKITGTKKGITVKGPTTFAAGAVNIDASGVAKGTEFAVASFKSGYTIGDFKKDYAASNKHSKSALKALNHAVDNTTFYGGVDAEKGQSLSGTIVLPKPGTYYLGRDGKKITDVTTLTVTGKASNPKPKSDATVKAMSGDRFGGDSKLPAKGTITFKNVSKGATKSPHFLVLQHVADGTTKKDIEDYFASGSRKPPSFIAEGDANTDVVSPGHAMTLSYKLPKGTYAELCFFPDLKTGMPHAFMGMIKIVTLS